MTILEAKIYARAELSASSPSPELDAEVLLMYVTGFDRTQLLFGRDSLLAAGQEQALASCLAQRKKGLPVAYITGRKEFFGYDFLVTQDVLIPKPDTELLVENALELIKIKAAERHDRVLTICDMCTGSGCAGLSVLKACMEEQLVPPAYTPALTMVDISSRALDVAKRNAERLLAPWLRQKLSFVQSNLFHNLGGSFDIILANPPYIPAAQTIELLRDGRGEPVLALNGDVDMYGNLTSEGDGLGIMRNLVPQAFVHLAPRGVLVVEAGEYNAEETERLFLAAGFKETCILKDLSGQLRDVRGWKG